MESPQQDQNKNAEELGKTYGALLNQENWHHEVDESVLQQPQDLNPIGEENPEASEKSKSIIPDEPEAPPSAHRIVEALLFVGGKPLTKEQACETIRGLTGEQFHEILYFLNKEYHRQGRPYRIQAKGNGYVMSLRRQFRSVLEKLFGTTREAQLSQVAIDVLSLVAYRQPATKQEIDSLRGAESGGVLRQLVRRGLVAIVQRGQSEKREVAYGTTGRFLELFNLKSLDDLPRTEDLQQI